MTGRKEFEKRAFSEEGMPSKEMLDGLIRINENQRRELARLNERLAACTLERDVARQLGRDVARQLGREASARLAEQLRATDGIAPDIKSVDEFLADRAEQWAGRNTDPTSVPPRYECPNCSSFMPILRDGVCDQCGRDWKPSAAQAHE